MNTCINLAEIIIENIHFVEKSNSVLDKLRVSCFSTF